jgi:hypothetical protein
MRSNRAGTAPASLLIPTTSRKGSNQLNGPDEGCLLSGTGRDEPNVAEPGSVNYTIFEGTSEIQRLVIARAISGLRIE